MASEESHLPCPPPAEGPRRFLQSRQRATSLPLLVRKIFRTRAHPQRPLSHPDDAETRETSAAASGSHDRSPDAPTANKAHHEEQHKRQRPQVGPAAPAAPPGAWRWRRVEPERDGVFSSKVGQLSHAPHSAPLLWLCIFHAGSSSRLLVHDRIHPRSASTAGTHAALSCVSRLVSSAVFCTHLIFLKAGLHHACAN